jgi:hypothetical protein
MVDPNWPERRIRGILHSPRGRVPSFARWSAQNARSVAVLLGATMAPVRSALEQSVLFSPVRGTGWRR